MKSIFFTLIFISTALQVNAQKQGICGKVLWVEGNQMPGPGRKPDPEKGIAREIHIYEVTTMQQAPKKNGFYNDLKTRFVTKATSKSNGTYKINLPPGEYSVFTKEPGGLFANRFDQNGAINTVVVKPGEFTKLTITINYKAAY